VQPNLVAIEFFLGQVRQSVTNWEQAVAVGRPVKNGLRELLGYVEALRRKVIEGLPDKEKEMEAPTFAAPDPGMRGAEQRLTGLLKTRASVHCSRQGLRLYGTERCFDDMKRMRELCDILATEVLRASEAATS
jgi:hypothetical protein